MSKKSKVTAKKLPDRLELLHYFIVDVDGSLTVRKTGRKVGWKDKRGYHHVRFKGTVYKKHRIIYKMWYGKDPGNKVIDHRDGNPSNNCPTNLRCVRHSANIQNQAKRRDLEGWPKEEPLPDFSGVEGWFGVNCDF